MTRPLTGAALDAHRRRVNRDAAEREIDVAVAMCRRRDEDAIAAAVAIYLIVKARRGGSGRETPLEILNKRYAKGEITEEEFDRMKRHLSE